MNSEISVVTEIKKKIDFIGLINSKTPIKRIDVNTYLGICPFHNKVNTSKNPTMFIDAKKQVYFCSECGKRGDLFDFLTQLNSTDVDTEIKNLCNHHNIEFEVSASNEMKRLFQMNKDAGVFFCKQLYLKDKKCLDYLRNDRHLSDETIAKFQIGYAPNTWSGLFDYMSSLGYSTEELIKGSLISKTKKGNYIDFFIDRAIFPFFDVNGNIIGFGGRTLSNDTRKYLNSRSTTCYRKNEFLFSLNFAKNSIVRRKYIILAEGNVDVITLHQAGFTNSVASCGTALTLEQCKIIAGYTKTAVICYDSDEAGQNATLKAISLLNSVGINCNVVQMDKNQAKDPDELISNYGANAFKKVINNSIPSLRFVLNKLAQDVNLNKHSSESDRTRFFSKVYKYISENKIKDEDVIKELKNYDI